VILGNISGITGSNTLVILLVIPHWPWPIGTVIAMAWVVYANCVPRQNGVGCTARLGWGAKLVTQQNFAIFPNGV